RDREYGPERGASRNAERERRRQRVAQQALQDDAGCGEEGANQGARQRARQPRDEEDLRVGVVAKRDGEVEDAPQIDVGWTDQRSRDDGNERQEPEAQDGAREATLQADARSRPRRPTGTSPRRPEGCRSTSTSTPYTSRRVAAVNASSGGPSATT